MRRASGEEKTRAPSAWPFASAGAGAAALGAAAPGASPGFGVAGTLTSAGFGAAALSGEENGDEIRIGPDGKPVFLSNNAGGILGGISTGQPVVARFAVKPTSSILTPRRSINEAGEEIELRTKGRHDPCVGLRATPIAEAMLAITLMDHYLRHRAQNADVKPTTPDIERHR